MDPELQKIIENAKRGVEKMSDAATLADIIKRIESLERENQALNGKLSAIEKCLGVRIVPGDKYIVESTDDENRDED